MKNPYEAPLTAASYDDTKRPAGVAVLSILAGLLGIVLSGAFAIVLWNWRENNAYFIDRGTAPSLLWLFTTLSIVIAFVASVGMWRGAKWGWWLACGGLSLFVIQNVGSAMMVNLTQGAPSISTFTSLDSMKFIVRGIVFTLLLAYWLRTRVRKFFRVETGRFKAVALASLCGIGATAVITIILQSIFLYRRLP